MEAGWGRVSAAAGLAGLLCLVGLSWSGDGRPSREPSEPPKSQHLPSAIIIGVKKGGTRALLEFLRLHPLVDAPGPEIHFFDRYYHRGLDWYRSQMPSVEDGVLTVEKTPAYFVKRDVPAKIAAMNPRTKLILVLRDPVTRAISDYTQSHAKGRTLKAFREMAFLDAPRNKVVDARWNAVRIGLYERHLRKWLPHFPLSQIHIVDGEGLVKDPLDELRAVENFLNLPPHIQPGHFELNATKGFPCLKRRPADADFKCLGASKGRKHPRVGAAALRTLRDFFRPHNQRLFQLLGRSFPWNEEPVR